MRIRKAAFAAVALVMALCATAVGAQTYSYSIYVDGDLNAGSGCTVPQMTGADARLDVSVSGGTSPQVVSVTRSVCNGSSFPAGAAIGGGYPVGLNNGVGGADVIELSDAISSLQINNSAGLRLAVVAQSAAGTDDLVTTASGGPIILGLPALPIPFLTFPVLLMLVGLVAFFGARRARRAAVWRTLSLFFVASGMVFAANFVVDGQVSDWNGVPPLATDPAGDATSGESAIDVTALFGAIENGRVFLRIDVRDLENNPPTVNPANATTLEDQPVVIALSGTDPEGAPITFSVATPPTKGTTSNLTSTGTNTADITYTPNANANGPDGFSVTASDGQGSSVPAAVTIAITPVNDAPSFTKGADQAIPENAGAQSVSGWATAILAGPPDEAATQTVSFTTTVVSTTGNLVFSSVPAVSPAGTLTFTAQNGTSGIATVSVVAQDNGGTANGGIDTSAAQTFTINVNAINHAPSFTGGASPSSLEDAGPRTVTNWATAINDGDGNTQIVDFQVTGNTNAALFSAAPAVSPTGTLTYTTAPNANGTATITLVLHDNGGTAFGGIDTSAPFVFTITVTAVNDAPSFTAGPNQSVFENAGPQTVNPWATAISPGPADESAQTVGFTASVTGTTGTLAFSAAPAVSPTGVLTYTPQTGTSGTATISVVAADNGGTANGGIDTSAAQTFTITVAGINHAPSFTAGPTQTSLEDAGAQNVAGWATAISDGDGNTQVLDFQVTNNTNAALFSVAPAVSPTGALTYTAAPNANGTATITLVLHDNGGTANGGTDTSAPQTFVINVTAVNDVPSFAGGTSASVLESAGPQTFANFHTAISAGPADEAGQTLSFTTTVQSTTGSLTFSTAPAVSATGTLTFTATNGTFGTATVQSVLADNGGTANGGIDTSAPQTFTITVNNVNDPPVFTVGPTQTVLEDAGAQTVAGFLTGIADGDDGSQTITFSITANTNAALFSAAPAIASNGTLTYTPAANANGTATITVQAQDNGGTANGGNDTSAPQTFVVNVTAVNDAPSFTGGTAASALESAGPQTFANFHTAISAGPADEAGQTLSFTTTVQSTTGSLTFSTAPAVSATGTLTFTATNGTFGTATVQSVLADNGGTANGGIDTSAPQTFTITVNNVNDPPVFTVGPTQTVLEDAGAQTVAGFLTGIADGDDGSQTITFSITANTNAALFSAAPAIASNGTLTYTPAANANGTATITVQAQDNGGTANGGNDTSAPQTFVVNVTAVNDAPSYTPGANPSVNEDSGPASIAWATAISSGPPDESGQSFGFNVATVSGGALFSALPTVSVAGQLTFTPAPNASGTATFTVTLQDNGGTANGGVDTSAPATLTITINALDDAPVAVNDSATVNEDSGATAVNVLANDTDIDGGPISIASVTQPLNGVVVITGGGTGLTYAPNPNYCNAPPGTTPDTFTYTLTPGGSTGTVSMTVTCVDDNPVAVNDSATITEDDPATAIPVLANDTDVDGGAITITAVTQPANGIVAITSGGTGLTYLPNPNYCNAPTPGTPDTFTYTLTPGGSTATVSVSVTCVVDNPVAVNDAATILEDAAATAINVLGNDSNPDGSPISVGSVTQPANGVVVITGGGTGLTYQPNPNYCNAPPGTTLDTFTYTISPGGSVGTVTVTVTCVDDAPVAVADSATVLEDAAATAVNVLANDTDVDGGPKSVGSVTQPANGIVAITGGGTGLTYQPNPNYCNNPPGTTLDTFTYTLAPGGSSTTVTITVTCVNDPPVPPAVPNIPVHTHIAIGVNDGTTGDLLIPGAITDPDSSNFVITGAPSTTANGGELAVNAATGAFTYNPPPDFTGNDTFTFTVCDDGTPVACSGAVTVTLVVSGPKIWFVDDDAVVVGTPDGTLLQPLPTLTAAAGVVAAGERIFVFSGNYTTGITLASGVELVGHGIDAATVNDFDGELAITPPSNSIVRPLVDQTPPVLTNASGAAITVTNNNTIRGVQIGNVNTAAISGTGFGTLTVFDDVRISTNNKALDLTNGTFSPGSVFSAFTSTAGVNNVDLDNVGGIVDLGTGALSGATGTAFSVVNGSTVQITYAGTITKASAGALIDIDTKPSGNVTLNGALSATAGTGIRLNNVDSNFSASGVVTLNGGDAAIDVLAGSAGTINFSNAASAITNPTNETVVINSSSPTFTFAGAITKNNNSVNGIRIDGNTAGSASFPNSTLTLSTGTANAVQLANNGTMTTTFTGGALTLSTTTGTAFNATGSGNVAVTGATNTATATAGMGLQIDNNTITAAGVTFRSINSTGGTNGIRLNNTGANAGLTVTGTGTAGSGGTISNATTTGISLAATRSVSLNRMNISGSGDDGINGATVTNFTCDFCVLTNNGNSTTDEGMQFSDLAGTANVTNSTFTNSAHNSVYIQNTTGTLAALTINANNFTSNSAANGNHHVLIEGVTGTPVFTDIDVTNNTVANAASIGVQIVGNNTTSMPSVTVTGNTFTNNILAIDASLVQGSNMTFNINNNTVNTTVAAGSHAINSNQGVPSTGTVRGRIDNVQIGTAGSVGSGSPIGNGVRVIGNDNGTKQYIVTNTTIRETRNGRGIEVVNRNGTGRMDATVTNNNVNTDALPANLPLSAILVQSNCVGTCNAIRADVAANSVTVPSGGCAFDLTGVCLALVETSTSTCELLDRAPTGAASANAELVGNNPASTSTSASAGCALTLTAPIVPP
ncbi:tandem-95 repeat protein [Tahibacter caeni]|uniref:tandem-95 repeat protein n=1 Tax=Tahibacter caeni TaxID=1453545 RepID=UPI00214838C0|nr:Ig-like domain-containing protein [Tahibacter caeni]